jgi:hypothetical protein
MNVGFLDAKRLWDVPDAGLIALVAKLRQADETSLDPATGERIEPSDADFLADAIEIGVETGAITHVMDDRDRPAFRWALEAWIDQRSDPPEWATRLRIDLYG